MYKKPYPFESGDGWDLLVFHKYFLVSSHTAQKNALKLSQILCTCVVLQVV